MLLAMGEVTPFSRWRISWVTGLVQTPPISVPTVASRMLAIRDRHAVMLCEDQ